MFISLECTPCIINSFLRLLQSDIFPDDLKEPAMRRLLAFLSEADYRQSPPALGREMHRMIRRELKDPDPYRKIKEKYNRMMLDLYSDFKEMINKSEDSFDVAMRLAIAGNVIDFGPQHQLDVMDTINRVMGEKLSVDNSPNLRHDLEHANTLLYIGDNCGEIVLDKLLLKTINLSKMYFAVRGGPVINDATIDDAKMVGMDKVAKVITTGDDAPGAVWESTSEEFKEVFNNADVIISKGQGNFEGLIDVPQNIYFLLVTKCELIGKRIGTQKGEFVVKRSPFMQKNGRC